MWVPSFRQNSSQFFPGEWSSAASHVHTALSERADHHSDLRLVFRWRDTVLFPSVCWVSPYPFVFGMWVCYHRNDSYRQFPRYQDNNSVEACEVPIPMVALVATAVSNATYFIMVLNNCCIAVCCHLWVAQWVPPIDGVFCEHFSQCLSRPHCHIASYPEQSHIRIPRHDAWHLW